jgi:glycosyltransferase involved in cell wall biosynthesis
MKIVFLAKRYFPHVGGVETHLGHIAQLLVEKGHQITIVTESHQENLAFQENIDGVQIYRIPLERGQTNKFAIWSWVVSHISLFFEADIIHIHDVFFWVLPFYPILFWKKIFMTFHGYEPPQPTEKQKRWHQVAAFLTKGNICIGGFHQKWYGVKPTIVSYGGVESMAAIGSDRTLKKKSAIFVGRLAEDTSILKYLEALQILKEKNIEIKLDVFGDGELREESENFVLKHNLSVKFYGFIPNAGKKMVEYSFAFTSQYLSLLEALQNHCSIISFAENELKNDYLTLTPFSKWITIAHSPKEIAEAVEQKKILPNEAVKWANEQTWEELANQYETLWSSH